MKMNKALALAILIISLLAITVASQISFNNEEKFEKNKVSLINDKIMLEERQECTTSFYETFQDAYEPCPYNVSYTRCLNTSGANTDCLTVNEPTQFVCKTGKISVINNKTDCKANNEFIITIDNGNVILKKQIDSSEWGPCIYDTEKDCLVVTCVSLNDGAHNGQFTDCNGGKTCQRFMICDNEIKVFQKNSGEDFVEEDPSFYLDKLPIKEVGP